MDNSDTTDTDTTKATPQDDVAPELERPEQASNGAASVDGAQADEQPEQTNPTDPQDPAALSAEELPAEALSAEELLERLNDAEAQNAQMKDGLLRARAEIENIRRRSQNEVVAARKFAIEGFAQELLGVKDSLDRASSVELDEGAGEAVQKMKEGLSLTLKQLDLALTRFSVVEVEAGPGVRFDPEHHQAISMTPCGDIEADHIVSVVQKGFRLKERLLRPAMVVVAAAAENK